MPFMNIAYVVCFACLCLVKAVGPIQNSNHPWYEAAPMALLLAAFLGSPQLAWARACCGPVISSAQKFIAAIAVASFTGTSIAFGSFPGVERPRWGGEAHFEVPAAFAAECLIAAVLLLVFKVVGRKRYA